MLRIQTVNPKQELRPLNFDIDRWRLSARDVAGYGWISLAERSVAVALRWKPLLAKTPGDAEGRLAVTNVLLQFEAELLR